MTETRVTVPPVDYARFIGQIELMAISMKEASVVNHLGPRGPRDAQVDGSNEASFESTDFGFRVFDKHHLNIKEGPEKAAAKIEVTFSIDYRSALPMTEDIFEVFINTNLPVNIWPFLREFLSNMTARMYWSHFQLPTFKVGTGSVSGSTTAETKSTEVRPPAARRGRKAKTGE